jgi:oxalate decarboxylase
VFRNSYYADISLSDWLTHSPPEMVAETLNIDSATIAKFSKNRPLVMPE